MTVARTGKEGSNDDTQEADKDTGQRHGTKQGDKSHPKCHYQGYSYNAYCAIQTEVVERIFVNVSKYCKLWS